MCKTCPCNSTWLMGPGEVASRLLGVVPDSLASRITRKVLFMAVGLPLAAGIIVHMLGWWLVPIMLAAAALAAGGYRVVRFLHRLSVQARPEPTHEMRDALTARGLRAIPAPVQVARPARRGRTSTGRRALPAAAKPLPAPDGAVVGKVVAAPAPTAGRRAFPPSR